MKKNYSIPNTDIVIICGKSNIMVEVDPVNPTSGNYTNRNSGFFDEEENGTNADGVYEDAQKSALWDN